MIYTKLITVRVNNCVLNGRKNQNTTFWFSPMKFGFKMGDEISEEWVLRNLNTLNANVLAQQSTKIKLN